MVEAAGINVRLFIYFLPHRSKQNIDLLYLLSSLSSERNGDRTPVLLLISMTHW